MSRLLPFKSEPTQSPEGARVLSLEDEATEEALSALSSDTAREILSLVYEEPRTPPEVRDEIGTSLQNVHYHLENLEEADLIQPAGSGYSEKGTEMTVYAPASEAVVLFAGAQDDGSRLQTALARLLGAVGLLALASIAVKRIARNTIGFGGLGAGGDSAAQGGGDGGGGASGGAQTDVEETGDTSASVENVSSGDGGDGGDGGGGDGGDGGGDVGIFNQETPTPKAEGTPTPAPEGTSTPAPEGTPMPTPEGTPTPAGTPGPAGTPTATPAGTPGPAGTPTPAATETQTPTPRDTPVSTPDRAIEGTPDPTQTATPAPTEAPVSPTDGAEYMIAANDGGLLADPAVAFFLGGLFMLAVAGAWWYFSG